MSLGQNTAQNTAQNTRPGGLRPPWPKGVSGNPGGRPSHAAIRQALRPHEPKTIERLIEHMLSPDPSASIAAIKLILGYLYGAPQSVQVEDMSDEELLAILMRRKDSGNTAQASNQ